MCQDWTNSGGKNEEKNYFINTMAKSKGTLWMALIAIALIIAAMVYVATTLHMGGLGLTSQTGLGGTGGTGTGGTGTGGTGGTIVTQGCPGNNPSVVTAVTDILNPGTTITPYANYRIGGIFTGTTSPTTKGTADILLNASGYLNTIKPGVSIDCGSNLVTAQMYAYGNASLTYYSDNGLTALTHNTANETVKPAGGSYNWRLHFQGTDRKSTGKQLLIVELSVPANVSSVSLNGGTLVPVPNGYTRQLTNGYAVAYLLPAIVGNTFVDYNLAVGSTTGSVVQGTVYTTVQSVEPFVETDGTFSDSGLAYNSLNQAKYHVAQTKNFIIV